MVIQWQAAQPYHLLHSPRDLLFCCSAFSQYVVPIYVTKARGVQEEEMEGEQLPFKGVI